MYDNLKSLGITNPEEIDRYSLRQESQQRYSENLFPERDKGEFFAKSVKFKYPRQRKTVVADGVGQGYKEVRKSARIYGISLMSLIKSASVTAAKLILSVRSSTTYVTGVSRNQ
ncbi:DUF3461 family protein [Escherichia coli]